MFPNLNDPADPAVTEALTRKCDQCKAPAGSVCRNHIRPDHPLPGRLIHFGRMTNGYLAHRYTNPHRSMGFESEAQ